MTIDTPQSDDLVDPGPDLVKPVSITVDGGLSHTRGRHMVRIAQLLYTFWDTGDKRFLDQAVDASFVDNTLPTGRAQGPGGPVAASIGFRRAVPDLTCELSDLLVVGDKVAVRLRFRGHFTGTYNGTQGDGQEIDFVAFDIQHVGAEKIVEHWHLEDNLTFLLQRESSRSREHSARHRGLKWLALEGVVGRAGWHSGAPVLGRHGKVLGRQRWTAAERRNGSSRDRGHGRRARRDRCRV